MQLFIWMWLNVTYLPLRQDSISKEAVHLAIGIQVNGYKEILGYQLVLTESSISLDGIAVILK